MNKFVQLPNLPHNAAVVLIGELYAGVLKKSLNQMGIEVVPVKSDNRLDSRVCSHADLSLIHPGRNRLITTNRNILSLKETLPGLCIDFSDEEINSLYPGDCRMNACLIGKYAFINRRTASNYLISSLSGLSYEMLEVQQGYTKCSICVVSENAIITSDIGIHCKAKESGIDSLLISPGYIDLPGYKYGFIGGASFKISDNVIAFTGSLDSHPDKDNIEHFLCKYDVIPKYLTDNCIFDIGSAIPIIEE